MDKEKKFTIEVTESQLNLMASCIEDMHRFAAGQTELWNFTFLLDNGSRVRNRLSKLQPLVTPQIPGASYSWNGGCCPNEKQREFIAKTYALYREIYHFLTVKDKLHNVYSSDTLTCKESLPLPIIREVPDSK